MIDTSKSAIDLNDLAHVRRLGSNPIVAYPCPIGGKGVINPHVTRFLNRNGSITDVFHVKPVYYETTHGAWRPMGEVAVHHGNRNIVLKMGWGRMMSQRYFQWLTKRQRLFPGKELAIEGLVLQPAYYEYAGTSTFYPDQDPESTTVDGELLIDDVVPYETTWAGCRDQTDSDYALPSDVGGSGGFRNEKLGTRYAISRMPVLFNTAALTGSTINSADLSVYLTTGDTTQACSMNIVTVTLGSNTNLVTSDYNKANWGTTRLTTDLANSSASTNSYNTFALNATGISTINKTGVTSIGLRSTLDIDNTTPTARAYFGIIFADTAGTTQDPKLVVTTENKSFPHNLISWVSVGDGMSRSEIAN